MWEETQFESLHHSGGKLHRVSGGRMQGASEASHDPDPPKARCQNSIRRCQLDMTFAAYPPCNKNTDSATPTQRCEGMMVPVIKRSEINNESIFGATQTDEIIWKCTLCNRIFKHSTDSINIATTEIPLTEKEVKTIRKLWRDKFTFK